jgi:hypothetical protein
MSERGRFHQVGCAGVRNPATGIDDLHVCAVTDDGHLWHAVATGTLSSTGFSTWTSLSDVEAILGDRGAFRDVDCAGNRGQFHLVGVALTGETEFEELSQRRAWHAIRNPGGGWSAATDVLTAAGRPPPPNGTGPLSVAIGFCNAGVRSEPPDDFSQLNVALTTREPPNTPTLLTIRSSNPIAWRPGSPPSLWMPAMNLSSFAGVPASAIARSVAERPFPS